VSKKREANLSGGKKVVQNERLLLTGTLRSKRSKKGSTGAKPPARRHEPGSWGEGKSEAGLKNEKKSVCKTIIEQGATKRGGSIGEGQQKVTPKQRWGQNGREDESFWADRQTLMRGRGEKS